MDRLFPRTYRAIRASGRSEESARRLLMDARRGDRCSIIMVKAIASLRRMSLQDLLYLMEIEGFEVVR